MRPARIGERVAVVAARTYAPGNVGQVISISDNYQHDHHGGQGYVPGITDDPLVGVDLVGHGVPYWFWRCELRRPGHDRGQLDLFGREL